ncbi:MAG: SIMPL domain-containing protein [Plesiomonas shigelloides]
MNRIVMALLVALGLAAGGWLAGYGVEKSRAPVRTVTVKGLAEQDVKADLALWPIRFVRAGNDLAQVRDEIQRDDTAVTAFLQKNGLADAVSFRGMDVTDRNAQQYGDGNVPFRFIITRTIMLRTQDVAKIDEAYKQSSQLVDSGVILSNEGVGSGNPVYLYNGLTTLKPAMIAEATQNAREAAQQFAHDSQSRLGRILVADQGVFQILPRDNAPMLQEDQQIDKTIRVVTTIKYQLVD